jgi:hypothetical protein
MDAFDRRAVEATIKQVLGPISTIDLCSRTHRTPMNVFLALAEERVRHPIDLFWVDEGAPAHFTLANERFSPVVFHSRHLELSGLIRALYATSFLGEVREDLATRICLRMVAEFLLATGLIDQALQCLAKSRLGDGIFMQEPDQTYLEHMPIDERYLCVWFFGLGHELGHCLRADVRDSLGAMNRMSMKALSMLTDATIDLFTPDLQARSKLRAIITRNENNPKSICYATSRQLQTEAICDLFSALTICRAADVILPETKGAPSPSEIVQELQLGFTGLMLIDQCRILASWFRDAQDEVQNQNLAMSNIALNVRSNVLRLALQDLSGNRSSTTLCGDGAHFLCSLEPSQTSQCGQFVARESIPIYSGLYKARSFLSSAEIRNPDLFYSYINQLHDCPSSQIEAARFVKRARAMNRSTPEIDLMAVAAKVRK